MHSSKAIPSFRRTVFDIGLFSIIANILLLVAPLYLLQVYDRVLPAANVATLVYLSIMAVLAMVFLGLFEIIRSIYTLRVAASMDRRQAAKSFGASINGPRAELGDIQPLRDLATVRTFVGSKGLVTLFDLPFAPLFMVLLAFIHPALGMLTFVGAVILFVLMALAHLTVGKMSLIASEQMVKVNHVAQAFARNAETVRGMGMGKNVAEAWGRRFAAASDLQDRSTAAGSVSAAISRATRMLLQLAVLGLGAWLVLANEMTAGMIFASSIISGRALQPLDQLIGSWRQTIDAGRAWQRLKKAGTQENPPKIRLPVPTGKLTIRDLVYVPPGSPTGREPILKRLSFEVAAGEAIAVIGASRAGKSTLAKLLVGAHQPSSGIVQVDGADLRTWDEAQLGHHIGYLSQEVQLLPGTIAENLSRFDPASSDDKIVEAARRAQAHDLILAQPDGYQTQIDSSGPALSGGERQRIGLARAFYGDPKILVLDEPNANLDQDGERALERALDGARKNGTTVIVITHRFSLAANCDRIMVLRNGIAEAFGPSADILKEIARQTVKPPEADSGSRVASFATATQHAVRWSGSHKINAS